MLPIWLVIAVLVASSPAAAQPVSAPMTVPVMVGGDPALDACPSTGTVFGLKLRGDGFLSVRSGPGRAPFREIDRVSNGLRLAICGQVGPWLAVIYANDDQTDCNVATPWPRRVPYMGPTRFGWFRSRYVGDRAG